MNPSVKIITTVILLTSLTTSAIVSKISNVRLTTQKSDMHPKERKLFIGGLLGGGSKDEGKDDNAQTTLMLLGVMERQEQIRKITALVDQLHSNMDSLRSMVSSEVSQLSQLANAGLNS